MSVNYSLQQSAQGKSMANGRSEVSSKAENTKASAFLKREQILQGATRVFLQHGYAGTSMDRVAAEAGVSKQTIYSHFQDKEGLFTALIERVTTRQLQAEIGSEPFQAQPSVLLRQIGQGFLAKRGDQEYISLLRVIIAESARFPELAQLYTRTVIQPVHQQLSIYLGSHPELNISDPEAIAQIFLGSLFAFLLSQELLCGNEAMPIDNERLINSLIRLCVADDCEA